MSSSGEQDKTRRSLALALAEDRLPEDVREYAQRLLVQLDRPIRVSLLGLPKSGKSALMTFLLGRQLVPVGTPFPTTEVTASALPQVHLTLQDGTKKTLQDLDPEAILAEQPIFVRFELALPALNKISVLEVVTSDDRVEQIRALMWAGKRTDIAIWATQSYAGPEHVLWRDVPDNIKDHAILVRTKADELGGPQSRQRAIDDLRAIAGDHFAQVMPLATLDAISARKDDGSVDKEMLRESGGVALISTIMRQIALGRQSTSDQAAILLHKNGLSDLAKAKADEAEAERTSIASRAIIEPVEQPADTGIDSVTEAEAAPAPASRPIIRPTRVTRPVTVPAPEPEAAPVVEPAPAPDPAPMAEEPAPVETPIPAADVAVEPAVGPLPKSIRDVLEASAQELAELGRSLAGADPFDPTGLIQSADTALTELDAKLESVDKEYKFHVSRLHNAVVDAQDMVQLMKLEQDTHAAFDAVSLLIQMRRHLLLEISR